MAKIQLKGLIVSVGVAEQVGEKKMWKQSVILSVPAYQDPYGEKKGKDKLWKFDILGDDVLKLNMNPVEHEGMKADFNGFVDSNCIEDKKKQPMYIINAQLKTFELK